MKNKYKVLGIVLIISLVLTSCSSSTKIDEQENSKIEELKKEIVTLNSKIEELNEQLNNNSIQSENLLGKAADIMELIRNKDMDNLSHYVHADKGLRFSPYFYVDAENHQRFDVQEVASLNEDSTIYDWGIYDGVGDPIELNFNDYYDKFVYDHDFINPHIIGNNIPIGFSNDIDNLAVVYPNAIFVEFHFNGFEPEYEGIDWSSLKLVLEQDGGQWYLVGIVHGQWTI